jgi:hypothetical protein
LDTAKFQKKSKRPPKEAAVLVTSKKFARFSGGANLEALTAVWEVAGLKMEE